MQKLTEKQKLFLTTHASKLLYSYEEGAGTLMAAQCNDLISALSHQTEDALDVSGPTDWDYEIAACVRDCDEAALDTILRAVAAANLGRASSPAKKKSSAENGKKGGRPRTKI